MVWCCSVPSEDGRPVFSLMNASEIHSLFAGTMPRQQLNAGRKETIQDRSSSVLFYRGRREYKVRAEGLDIVVAQLPMLVKGVVELGKRYYM